jgi:hypothetical protein
MVASALSVGSLWSKSSASGCLALGGNANPLCRYLYLGPE